MTNVQWISSQRFTTKARNRAVQLLNKNEQNEQKPSLKALNEQFERPIEGKQ